MFDRSFSSSYHVTFDFDRGENERNLIKQKQRSDDLLRDTLVDRCHAWRNLWLDSDANDMQRIQENSRICITKVMVLPVDAGVVGCPVTPMSACYPDRPIVICNYPKTAPSL